MPEDIFRVSSPSEHPIMLVVRYNEKAKTRFNNATNQVKFEDLLRALSYGEWPCFLSRRTDDEILISVPMHNPAGQADLVLSYNTSNHLFDLQVSYANKTKFRSSHFLPSPEYSLPLTAKFTFLTTNESYMNFEVLAKMHELKQQADKLQIAPSMSVENQKEIWTEYIEAQSQMIDALNVPFSIEGEPRLIEEPRENGEGVYRYKLEMRLPEKSSNEFIPLRNALKDDLGIESEIDSQGNCTLRLDDIFRGVDTIIQKKFADRYERDAAIGCVVPVRPIPAADRLAAKLGDVAKFRQKGAFVSAGNLTVPYQVLVARMAAEKYSPVSFNVHYYIKYVSNLYKSPHVEKYGITFSEDGNFQRIGADYNKKEICLPEPSGASTFDFEYAVGDNMESKYAFLDQTLRFIYGEENIDKSISYKFRPDEEVSDEGFSKAEWEDIWRDIYALDHEYNSAAGKGCMFVSFDFETKEELDKALSGIESINKYQIMKSPRDDDFQFKVQLNLSAKKTEKDLFLEKLKKLNGVDFLYDLKYEGENGKTKTEHIYVGKLNGYESTTEKLVLVLPNMYKDEQAQTERFLKFWKRSGSKIDSVHANLIGDRSKLNWLQDAIAKLGTTASIKGPNNVPVNENIREFIFDSSKAEAVFKYEMNDIEETPEFKEFDKTSVLKLNDSQKKAVLKGVEARDLCMLQGPPGTGKTTVIAELIWQHIRQNQGTKLLLTSETNLAVDNALEKLMNEKAVNPDMARYLTLIKPLRFGKPTKFEEEGKRYSIERIEKWVDDATTVEDDYDAEVLSEENAAVDEDEAVVVDVNDNIVQHWMRRIADRSAAGDPRYAEVLKDWTIGLAMPDKETKVLFRDLYYDNVNVVGSTCSSTGSPGFLLEYLRTFKGLKSQDYTTIKRNLFWWKNGSINNTNIIDMAMTLGVADPNMSIDDIRKEVQEACTIRFDTVIMDEASKATPPELLLPLCFGRKSIIIGDHRQLPPMLNEKSFKEALLELNTDKAKTLAEDIDRAFVDTSQFKRMILNKEVSPTIKSTFNIQYRMHPDINAVIKQFYADDEGGGLECGLDPALVDSPDLSNPQSRYHGFLAPKLINPDIHTIWIDVKAPEESDGSSKVNVSEVRAINTVLEKLSSAQGFKEYMAHWDTLKDEYKRNEEKEIGVISFYGRQVNRIKKVVRPRARQLNIRTKINTVDKFQGMERNIVIVSTVRSNKAVKGTGIEDNTRAGFADSPERLNVALSRARRLLIVVGNKDFFSTIRDKQGNYLYRNAIQEIERSGRVIKYTDLING